MKILVTGTAGFISHHVAQRLYGQEGVSIFGLDSINDYYDKSLKMARLQNQGFDTAEIEYNKPVTAKNGHRFIQLELEDSENLNKLFAAEKFDVVIHLAAQAGVRYSLTNPHAYMESNIKGFLNILEACRHNNVQHLIYASSSSVYGLNTTIPFSVLQNVDHPISLYAASKKSNELMAHVYSYLFGLPTTGLRFFTVYGTWGRPDMAIYLFTKNILEGKPIEVFNNGNMMRDFTYVGDIAESIARLINKAPKPDAKLAGKELAPNESVAPYQLFNIGNNKPIGLIDFVKAIEKATGKKAEIINKPMQPGDVQSTFADVQSLFDFINFKPQTDLEEGIQNFVDWYINYHNTNNTN